MAVHFPFYLWLYLYLLFLILWHLECVALVGLLRQMGAWLRLSLRPLLRLLLNQRERQQRTALGLGSLREKTINSNRSLLYSEIFIYETQLKANLIKKYKGDGEL